MPYVSEPARSGNGLRELTRRFLMLKSEADTPYGSSEPFLSLGERMSLSLWLKDRKSRLRNNAL